MNKQDPKPLTEGEKIIEQFFQDKSIKYKCNVKIPNLKGDSKGYREADFYLPKFKIYVEFFGMWNVGDHKERYREKKKVYQFNHVPCIYLYPENLGFLEQAIHMRIEEELKSKNMRTELVRFKHYQLGKDFDKVLLIFFIIGSFLLLWLTRNNQEEWAINARVVIIAIVIFYWIIVSIAVLVGLFEYLQILFGKPKK